MFFKTKYLIVVMTVAPFLGKPSVAQTSTYGELQAAYIYNFAKYIKWPGEHAAFIIGVYGESGLLADLKKVLKGKKVAGAEIEIKEFAPDAPIECQIVFIPVSNSKGLNAIKQKVNARSILIVTEEDLIKKGAAISFLIENNRLRFKLSTKELSQAGLTASEGLLKLAILSE